MTVAVAAVATKEAGATKVPCDIKDPGLAGQGQLRIEWASTEMPVLRLAQERFQREQPLKGVRLSACLHITSETANLPITLRDGGADAVACASNPLATQGDVAPALVRRHGIPIYPITREEERTYSQH